jgi:uncharacterized membrane protein YebE (DUF533 family)
MIFTNQELAAILRLANAMANADGRVTNEESTMIAHELVRFGVDSNKFDVISSITTTMTNSEACHIVSRMTSEEKKYVAAYLGTIIFIDQQVDESEIKLWTLISTLCDLPTMRVIDAVKIMSEL